MKFRIEYDTGNRIRTEEKEYAALTDAVSYAQGQMNRCDWPPAMEPKCARVYTLDADGGYDENSYVSVEFTKKMEDVVFEIVFIRDDGGATKEVVGREKKEFDDFEQGVGYVHEKMESLEWPEGIIINFDVSDLYDGMRPMTNDGYCVDCEDCAR